MVSVTSWVGAAAIAAITASRSRAAMCSAVIAPITRGGSDCGPLTARLYNPACSAIAAATCGERIATPVIPHRRSPPAIRSSKTGA